MIIKFSNYIKESLEIIDIKYDLQKLFDIYGTYQEVCNFLKKELINNDVIVDRYYPIIKSKKGSYYGDAIYNGEIRNITDVLIDKVLNIIFVDNNNNLYYIPDKSKLQWGKLIDNKYNPDDPYGEDEWTD